MKTPRKHTGNMRKYYQLGLIIICFVSIVTLLIYRHEYYRLRYVLEVLNFFGKPGLSEIEFCGPGFNATLLSEILRNSSMEVRDTPPLFQQIDENFYSYSSFLRSRQKYEQLTQSFAYNIDTIVIGKAGIEPNFRCNIWLGNSLKPKNGKFTAKSISKPKDGFQLYVFQCFTAQDLGKPTGISFYTNDYNTNPWNAAIHGLIEVNSKRKVSQRSSIRFINNNEPAICVIPNQIPITTRDDFIEFLVFHHMMGVNYFTIYDSMISADVIKRLNLIPADITSWDLKFFPLNYPFVFSKSYEIVRDAIELDCMFRHFKFDKEDNNKASHAMVLSWDEFLVPRFHNNLRAVIDDFDPARRLRTIIVKELLFCSNQKVDINADIGFPEIVKKTHYYDLPQQKRHILIRNLDSMATFEDILKLNESHKEVPLDVLGAHKYTECRDAKSFSGYNSTQMEMFPNKFEGAMLKFGQSLVSNKIYRLYRSGQIWEKTVSANVRDML